MRRGRRVEEASRILSLSKHIVRTNTNNIRADGEMFSRRSE